MLNPRVKRFDLTQLVPLDRATGHRNARYMTAAQFQRLVENIAADGALTSAPLIVYDERDPETPVIASGNHRVAAAIKAGIIEADCIEVVDPLPHDKIVALQLSHNAVEGQDDPNILAELYAALDLELKEYSGLADDDFKVEEPDLSALGTVAPQYEEMVLSFLPEDAEAVQQLLKEIGKSNRHPPRLAARLDDFAAFFETVVRVKNSLNIHNTAVAVHKVVLLAKERLDQLDAERDEAEAV